MDCVFSVAFEIVFCDSAKGKVVFVPGACVMTAMRLSSIFHHQRSVLSVSVFRRCYIKKAWGIYNVGS